MTSPKRIAADIIAASRNAPADAVLRERLKTSRLTRSESAIISDLVFTYFRWRGWLDLEKAVTEQIEMAADLDQRFVRNPDSFSSDDLKHAVPAWVEEEVEISRDWLVSLQRRPALWIRTKRGTASQIASALGHCEPFPGVPEALEYCGRDDLFRRPEFHAGAFEVQDIASQIVSLLCHPAPGAAWWDACAGEGGKTLHLSDLMQNKGLIWASDRSERRLARLKQRAARAKAFNYRAAPWDGSEKLPTKTQFDGVLVDAPCSGVGTWQRNPHARWTTGMKDVQELAVIQQQLLLHASRAVKPGGKLIYAVCTLARTETIAVADWCSQQFSGFAPCTLPALPNEASAASSRKWMWPQTFRGNGMFVAAWQRLPVSP